MRRWVWLLLGLPVLAQVSLNVLTFRIGSTSMEIDGAPQTLSAPPLVLYGTVMLPLHSLARLLALPYQEDSGGVVQLGPLALDPRLGEAALGDQILPEEGNFAVVGKRLYISVRLLAKVLQAGLVQNGSLIALTVPANLSLSLPPVPPQLVPPPPPEAFFVTNHQTYRIGQPVRVTDYSFDPNGAPLVAEHWSGLKPAYFTPGPHTITLQVTSADGMTSAPFQRTIEVLPQVEFTPLAYDLRYGASGTLLPDPQAPSAPVLHPLDHQSPLTLVFSDSPEKVDQPGILEEAQVSGAVRLLAYHLNEMPHRARLWVLLRNPGSSPATVTLHRLGEAAPARLPSILGQATLLNFWSSHQELSEDLLPGQVGVLYRSPRLPTGYGVSLLADLNVQGTLQLMVILDPHDPRANLSALSWLPLDGIHPRGVYTGADLKLSLDLSQAQLPAQLLLGDRSLEDPGTPPLKGDYGVSYTVDLRHACGVALALDPLSGNYAGALELRSGTSRRFFLVPAQGVLSDPAQPALITRLHHDHEELEFIPPSGSDLPVSLVFYRVEECSEASSSVKGAQ